ncbi:hypothetical protein D3C86_2109160 [compost metagenome]
MDSLIQHRMAGDRPVEPVHPDGSMRQLLLGKRNRVVPEIKVGQKFRLAFPVLRVMTGKLRQITGTHQHFQRLE